MLSSSYSFDVLYPFHIGIVLSLSVDAIHLCVTYEVEDIISITCYVIVLMYFKLQHNSFKCFNARYHLNISFLYEIKEKKNERKRKESKVFEYEVALALSHLPFFKESCTYSRLKCVINITT